MGKINYEGAKEIFLHEVSCPICDAKLNTGARYSGDARPSGPHPGDLAICAECFNILCFIDKTTLVEANDASINRLDEADKNDLFALRDRIKREKGSAWD